MLTFSAVFNKDYDDYHCANIITIQIHNYYKSTHIKFSLSSLSYVNL